MPIRSVGLTCWLSLSAIVVAGCASPGPLMSHRTTVGTLKSANAQLEHEKTQLAHQVAELEAENRRYEDRLAEEEQANGWLSARLNDAKDLLSRQGVDSSGLESDAPAQARKPQRSRTSPAAAPRKQRKTPFAEIPGELNAVPHPDADESDESFDDSPPRTSQAEPRTPTSSRASRDRRWLPIAVGTSEPSAKVR